jgi:hypothetical protein
VARDATLIIIIRDKTGRNEGEKRKDLRGGKKPKKQKKSKCACILKLCVF